MFGGYYFGETYLGNYGGIVQIILSIADSVTTADAKAFTVKLFKSDSVTSSDLASKTTTYIRTASDSVTTSDATVKSPTKVLADSVTATDANAKTVTLSKSDSVTMLESLSRTVTWLKTFADSVTTSDARVKSITLNKSDNVTITDSSSRTMSYNLSLADTVTLSDLLGAAKFTVITLTIDSLGSNTSVNTTLESTDPNSTLTHVSVDGRAVSADLETNTSSQTINTSNTNIGV